MSTTTNSLAYLKSLHQQNWEAAFGPETALEDRLRKLTGPKYDAIMAPIQGSDAIARVEEEMCYCLIGEIRNDGFPYESIVCVDLLNDKVFAGFYASDSQMLRVFEEDPELLPPPFRMWKEDEH